MNVLRRKKVVVTLVSSLALSAGLLLLSQRNLSAQTGIPAPFSWLANNISSIKDIRFDVSIEIVHTSHESGDISRDTYTLEVFCDTRAERPALKRSFTIPEARSEIYDIDDTPVPMDPAAYFGLKFLGSVESSGIVQSSVSLDGQSATRYDLDPDQPAKRIIYFRDSIPPLPFPLRAETSDASGRLIYSADYLGYVESDGIWYPTRVVEKYFTPANDAIRTTIISNARINQGISEQELQ